MLRIHDELRRGSLVNCTKLVKSLEVCRKTIVRDIAFMRDRLDLPIDYDSTIQAYRYTHPVNSFPTGANWTPNRQSTQTPSAIPFIPR